MRIDRITTTNQRRLSVMETLFYIISVVVYVVLAVLALWGAFCIVLVWRRVSETRFSSEYEQDGFFEELEPEVLGGDFAAATEICEDDRRAMPQLTLYAIENREMGLTKVRRRMIERFQQDVLADIEHRLSWVSTVTKSAPMVGLFGTVLGMMGAFQTLATSEKVNPTDMAGNIGVALITTASGLAIAVPLVLATAAVNIRIRKMEDLIAQGLSRLMDAMAVGMGLEGASSLPRRRAEPEEPASKEAHAIIMDE